VAQSSGDSQSRQLRRAAEWIETHGHYLDQTLTFQDKAVSAKAGDPVKKGQLGQLLKLCKSGQISPDVKGNKPLLIVEDISRLSRESINPALSLILEVLEFCDLVVLSDAGKIYTSSMNLTDIIVLLVGVSRAHEENVIKAERIRQARAKKTSQYAETGIKLTKQCPVWLKLSPCKTDWLLQDNYVALVRYVFDRIEAGDGMHKILTQLNDGNFPPAKRGGPWTVSSLSNMVKTKKVIGEFENTHGQIFEGYYPQIINPEQFYRVQNLRKLRGKGSGGPSGTTLRNLFRNIATCGQCEDGKLQFLDRGNSTRFTYLVCSNARQGRGCKQHSYRYEEVEEKLLALFSVLDFSRTTTRSHDLLQSDIGKLDELKFQTENLIENLITAVEATGNVSLVTKLNSREAELSSIKLELESKHNEASASRSGDPNAQFKSMMNTPKRQLLNDFLRRNISLLSLTPQGVLIGITGQPWFVKLSWSLDISPILLTGFHNSESLTAMLESGDAEAGIFEVVSCIGGDAVVVWQAL